MLVILLFIGRNSLPVLDPNYYSVYSSLISYGGDLVTESGPTVCNLHGLPGSSVHGFPSQEYWSGLPFPSPVYSSFVPYMQCNSIHNLVFCHTLM